ncbi:MAG: AEC family transporter [Gammaproteobacteria bacterium]|nr:AEC family transporter [Gammaproteobacteria bacterium]
MQRITRLSWARVRIWSDVLDVLNMSLPLFGLVLIGWLSAKVRRIGLDGLAWMQFFIMYVALPALFFQILRKTPVEQLTNFKFVATATGTTALVFVLGFVLVRLVFASDMRTATIQALAGAYSNIGYMGPALTLAALGEAAVVPTALILCFDNALLFTLVPILMALGSGNQESIVSVLTKKVLLHPFILASAAGIAAAFIELPVPTAIDQILDNLKNSAAPAALFTMGVVIAQQTASRRTADVAVLLVLKMVLHPLLIFVVMHWIGGFDPIWLQTAVLMAALPPALNIFVLAQFYDTYVARASTIVLLGTVLASISVTLVLYLIAEGLV